AVRNETAANQGPSHRIREDLRVHDVRMVEWYWVWITNFPHAVLHREYHAHLVVRQPDLRILGIASKTGVRPEAAIVGLPNDQGFQQRSYDPLTVLGWAILMVCVQTDARETLERHLKCVEIYGQPTESST